MDAQRMHPFVQELHESHASVDDIVIRAILKIIESQTHNTSGHLGAARALAMLAGDEVRRLARELEQAQARIAELEARGDPADWFPNPFRARPIE